MQALFNQFHQVNKDKIVVQTNADKQKKVQVCDATGAQLITNSSVQKNNYAII
jgi:hypothetical protein